MSMNKDDKDSVDLLEAICKLIDKYKLQEINIQGIKVVKNKHIFVQPVVKPKKSNKEEKNGFDQIFDDEDFYSSVE